MVLTIFTFVFLLLRDVFSIVQTAWISAIRTRAAIRPRTIYKRVSDRSKKESNVSLALVSSALLTVCRKNISNISDYKSVIYKCF